MYSMFRSLADLLYLLSICSLVSFTFFFFNDTATTEIYTLSLHDALPIFLDPDVDAVRSGEAGVANQVARLDWLQDRKSTRLNSSHGSISYAVFCLKKKKNTYTTKLNNNKIQHENINHMIET